MISPYKIHIVIIENILILIKIISFYLGSFQSLSQLVSELYGGKFYAKFKNVFIILELCFCCTYSFFLFQIFIITRKKNNPFFCSYKRRNQNETHSKCKKLASR